MTMEPLVANQDQEISSYSKWMAKVLSGSHKDIDISLMKGRQTLGQHEDCDIVLWDESLPDVLLSLDVTDDEILLDVIDKNCSIILEGQAITEHNLAIDNATIIQIGDFIIGFYPQGESLQSLLDQQKGRDTDAQDSHDGLESMIGGDDSESTLASQNKPVGSSSRLRRKFYPLTLLMIVAALAFYIFDNKESPPEMTVEAKVQSLIQQQKLNPEWGAIEITYLPPRRIVLEGFVKTTLSRNHLQQLFEKSGFQVDATTLYVQEDEQSLSQATLLGLGYHQIQVQLSPQLDKLVLRGYLSENQSWAEAKRQLMAAIPHIQNWQDEVETRSSRIEALHKMLDQAGLGNRIGLVIREDHIEVRGMLSQEDSVQWQKVQRDFIKRFGQEPLLVAAQPEIKPLKIRSVNLSPIAYVTLASGEILMIGAKLENNYTVQAIYADRITLKRDGEIINYNITSNDYSKELN